MFSSIKPIKQNRSTTVIIILTLLVIISTALIILQDLLESTFKGSSFYFSESLIFSSFWWLFAPLLYYQYKWINNNSSRLTTITIAIIIIPILFHLLAFPALVWIISALFYYHTFRYSQTFEYGFSVHLYKLIFLYTIPVLAYQSIKRILNNKMPPVVPPTITVNPIFENHFIIAEGNRRISIAAADILYITASSPYVHIHIKNKKYLYNNTLKEMARKTDNRVFVRIHKSTIVNINHTVSYISRLNGDYDVLLHDGTSLRVSRNYAGDFKTMFQQRHQVAAK
jgi:hypothetical protein